MRREMARDELDVVHFPANYGFGPAGARRIVITLHDAMNVLPIRSIVRGLIRGSGKLAPRSAAMMAYLHCCTCLSLRGADLVLTDSAHAAARDRPLQRLRPRRQVVSVPPLRRRTAAGRRPDSGSATRASGTGSTARSCSPTRSRIRPRWSGPGACCPSRCRRARQIVFFARRPELLPIVHEAVAAGRRSLLRAAAAAPT